LNGFNAEIMNVSSWWNLNLKYVAT
jgi:hypothetical protein